jgi:hypothetical protein
VAARVGAAGRSDFTPAAVRAAQARVDGGARPDRVEDALAGRAPIPG